MNRIILSLTFVLIMVFSVASLSVALEAENSNLHVSQVRSYEMDEDEVYACSVNLENFLDEDMEDMRVTIYIPDLDIRESTRRFDIDSGDELTKRIILALPEGVEPGEYLARVTISNDELRRVKHRYLEVR